MTLKAFRFFPHEAFFLLNVDKIVTMNKKHEILLEIALVLLFTGIALATSINLSASSDIVIYAFDQNPPGSA
jgi:hypothetical protein